MKKGFLAGVILGTIGTVALYKSDKTSKLMKKLK